jgi:hypothetical protein
VENSEKFLLSMARMVTNILDDDEALNQFSRLLVIGELRDKKIDGLLDSNGVDLIVGKYTFSSYFSFLNAADAFVWRIKNSIDSIDGIVLLAVCGNDIKFLFIKKEDLDFEDSIICHIDDIQKLEENWNNILTVLKKEVN